MICSSYLLPMLDPAPLLNMLAFHLRQGQQGNIVNNPGVDKSSRASRFDVLVNRSKNKPRHLPDKRSGKENQPEVAAKEARKRPKTSDMAKLAQSSACVTQDEIPDEEDNQTDEDHSLAPARGRTQSSAVDRGPGRRTIKPRTFFDD